MQKIVKPIEVVAYNSNWPILFETEANLIKAALGCNCIAVHHVGSTAVNGLSAKPIIDIIAEVKSGNLSINQLEKADFVYKGEWNIPFKYGFTKRGQLQVNLHVFEENHPEIELNLVFRDYLRNNSDARNKYQNLKIELLKNEASFQKQNGALFSGYNLGKDAFIRKIIDNSGFQRLRFLKCTHRLEWQEYHRIRKSQIFDSTNIEYDENHPTITDANHAHFILCHGTKVVCVAHIEFLNTTEIALRSLAADKMFQNQGFGTHMLQLLEKWLTLQNAKLIKVHAHLKAEKFYRKHGYQDMHFDDQSISPDVIDLGKVLL